MSDLVVSCLAPCLRGFFLSVFRRENEDGGFQEIKKRPSGRLISLHSRVLTLCHHADFRLRGNHLQRSDHKGTGYGWLVGYHIF